MIRLVLFLALLGSFGCQPSVISGLQPVPQPSAWSTPPDQASLSQAGLHVTPDQHALTAVARALGATNTVPSPQFLSGEGLGATLLLKPPRRFGAFTAPEPLWVKAAPLLGMETRFHTFSTEEALHRGLKASLAAGEIPLFPVNLELESRGATVIGHLALTGYDRHGFHAVDAGSVFSGNRTAEPWSASRLFQANRSYWMAGALGWESGYLSFRKTTAQQDLRPLFAAFAEAMLGLEIREYGLVTGVEALRAYARVFASMDDGSHQELASKGTVHLKTLESGRRRMAAQLAMLVHVSPSLKPASEALQVAAENYARAQKMLGGNAVSVESAWQVSGLLQDAALRERKAAEVFQALSRQSEAIRLRP